MTCTASTEGREKLQPKQPAQNERAVIGNQVCEKTYNLGWPVHLSNLNLKATIFILSSVRTKLSVLPRTTLPSAFKADWIMD